jgi:hypothetical protein
MIARRVAVIIFAKYCEAALKQIKKERKKITFVFAIGNFLHAIRKPLISFAAM